MVIYGHRLNQATTRSDCSPREGAVDGLREGDDSLGEELVEDEGPGDGWRESVGVTVGDVEGDNVGSKVPDGVGSGVTGIAVGLLVGSAVGLGVGLRVGGEVGGSVGLLVGASVGLRVVGNGVGDGVVGGFVGLAMGGGVGTGVGGGIAVGTKVGVSEGASEKNSEGIAGGAVRLSDGDCLWKSWVGSTVLRKETGTEGTNTTGELEPSSFHGSFALSSICEGGCVVEAGAMSEGMIAVDPVDGFGEGAGVKAEGGFTTMDGRFEGVDKGIREETKDGFATGCLDGC